MKRTRTNKIKLAGSSKVKNKADINLDADHTTKGGAWQVLVSPSCQRRDLVSTGNLTGHSSCNQNVSSLVFVLNSLSFLQLYETFQ